MAWPPRCWSRITMTRRCCRCASAAPLPTPRRRSPLLAPIFAPSKALIMSFLCRIIENDFVRPDWRSRELVEICQYTLIKWILCLLIGQIVGLLGFFINLAVENVAGQKFVVTSNMMLARRFMAAFLVFSSSNLGLTLFASLITAFVAPEAAGSGIPEVKAYLNGVDAPAIFSLRTLIVKIVGSICAVSSSLNVGKAGPMVHCGACIAALLGQGGSKKFRLTWKWLRFFKNDRDRRDLVTCGSAAGIAAAFRAPVGGVLFALEEMASWWRSALLWRTFFTTAVVAIVLRALIDLCLSGQCGLFGKGGLIMYDVTSVDISYHLWDVPAVLLLAFGGGILGSIYNSLLNNVLKIYNVINKKGVALRILLACSLSIFTSCLLFGLPWLASCRSCPSDPSEPCPTIGRSGNYKKFQCPPGYYNDLASLFFNTNDDAIKNLFSKGTDSEFQRSSMLIFFAACFFLSIFSYGIVAPAGLFVPVIVTGAAYGRFAGMLLLRSKSNLNHGLFAVLGSASLLGGSMRTTVSLCVIILELTNNLLLLPLIMIVLLISKTVADVFNENVYDLIMTLKGLPYLEDYAEPYMRQLAVGDVVTGPLQIFRGFEKVANVVHVLRTTRHNGFPVIDEPPFSESPVLYGLILRAHLLTLLRSKAFSRTPSPVSQDAIALFSVDDFSKKGLGHDDRIEDLAFSNEEMEMYIDLHPFTNTSPYAVVETMSLAKALMLFRQVGLRHLLVIPKFSGRRPVVGILTRHDFRPEHVLNLHPLLANSRWKKLRLRFPQLRKLV
ncbi:putative chloride channel-like protein CLC-g isoform X2 [Salvia miltiorrhiza]|uniref:putative chloride channel-like protein CLC-g isoform X2 n=1 Tax=Salvia miltiorrhiza TaxID=226208 RepID=UPI0025ACA2F1|nr:putative chloride channel-like protein CLC-g isoform X2 [Salvia miltiorrhiza]